MANGVYVYAIAPTEARLPEGLEDIRGLQGTALFAVASRDLAAIASTVDPAEIHPTPEQVLAHEAVVEGVRRVSPALPVRFGTVLADADSVRHILDEQHDTLALDLSRIGDKVELGLSVLWDEPPADDAEDGADATQTELPSARGAGTRYLLERLSEHRRQTALERKAREVAREVESALAPRVLDRRSKLLPTARMPLRAAYLLDPSHVDAFRAAFDELRQANPPLRFLLSGPWPPYSFVTPPQSKAGAQEDGNPPNPAETGAWREHG